MFAIVRIFTNNYIKQGTMRTEKAISKLHELSEQEIKETRRSANMIFDSSDFNRPPMLIRESGLAEMFNVHPKTIASWRNAGKLAYVRIDGSVFYKLDDVNAFIARHRVRAKATM